MTSLSKAILAGWTIACASFAAESFEYLQPGITMTLFAEHPEVVTPTGIDVDARGRVWVVSSHTHFRPKNYSGPQHDEVLILEDTDGDGRSDKRTVFYTNTVATMDLELDEYDSYVYLAERDRILRIKTPSLFEREPWAPSPATVASLTSEADYPHNGLSGLAFHKGRLHFSLGENHAKPWTLSSPLLPKPDGLSGMEPPPQTRFHGYRQSFASTPPDLPDVPDAPWIPDLLHEYHDARQGGIRYFVRGTGEGGIFRCDPDGRNLRRIARGFWNPFGLGVRPDGEIFAVDNDPGEQPPCRLLHIIHGGDYGYNRKYGKSPTHPFVAWNGELRDTLPMLHAMDDAPCAVQALGQGLITTTWSDHRLDFFPLEEVGPSFRTQRIPLLKGKRDFRPVSLARAPDKAGKIVFYLTDWVKVDYTIHGQGRIWCMVIDPKEATWLDTRVKPSEWSFPEAKRHRLYNWSKGLDQLTDPDPIVAQTAITRRAKEHAWTWEQAEVSKWPDTHRVAAVLALKRMDEIDAAWRQKESKRGLSAEAWMRVFLKDPHPEVRFETLRWIADQDRTALLPAVEELLEESELTFRVFTAAIATVNTLKGQPAKGVRDPALLLAKVKDRAASPALRAYALRLLPEFPLKPNPEDAQLQMKYPKGLSLDLLKELLTFGDETLSREAIRVMAGKPTRASEKILIGLAEDKDQVENIRLEAMAGLGGFPPSYEGSYKVLAHLAGNSNTAIRDEARRGLRFSKLSVQEKTNLTEGRPALTDTEAWLKRLDAVQEPVDVLLGERVFHHPRVATCGRCHRNQGRGNIVGPDLTALGPDTERKWLLEAILNPNASVAPEYTPRMLTLKDGSTFTGFHLRTGGGGAFETLRDANGQNKRIKRDDIVSIEEVQVSLMPMGLPYTMTDRELRDLMAFLMQSPAD